MKFILAYTKLTWGRLCRRRGLLAGLVLLCLLLPVGAGQAAQALLRQEGAFTAAVLAVTAPAGDRTPELLEQYMGAMEGVTEYCRVQALEEPEALAALERGEVTAVLVLPEHFLAGVMDGSNPDLRLIVRGDQPLEALLLLWAGQSASDMLSAFQSGVYAVLEQYENAPPAGLSREQVVWEVNLAYIQLALDRGALFRVEEVSAAALPIPLHYGLALLVFFSLTAAPLFVPIYRGNWLAFQRRLGGVGRNRNVCWLCGVLAGAGTQFLLLAPALAVLDGTVSLASVLLRLGAAALMALWSALFCGLCCLAVRGATACGTVCFVLALGWLALAGGILPPVLLPAGVRALSGLSPVGWLMELAAWSMGCGGSLRTLALLGMTGAVMAALSRGFYGKRVEQEELL